MQGATPPQKEMIEQAAQILAQVNVELCCAFIQKNAVEKAIPEMDKRLATVSLTTNVLTIPCSCYINQCRVIWIIYVLFTVYDMN